MRLSSGRRSGFPRPRPAGLCRQHIVFVSRFLVIPKKTVSRLHLWGQLAYRITHFTGRASSWVCGMWVSCAHAQGGWLVPWFFTYLAIPSALTSLIDGNERSSCSSSQKMWRMPIVILATLFHLLPRSNIEVDAFFNCVKSQLMGRIFFPIPVHPPLLETALMNSLAHGPSPQHYQ